MKDLIEELRNATRRIQRDTLPGGPASVVALARSYPAVIDDVWDALTSPDRVARWFLPVTGDLRPGGTFQLEGNAGGQIRVCDRPHHLQLTWVFGEDAGAADTSIVDVRLEAGPGETRLMLEHTAVVPPEMWEKYGAGGVGVGWDLTLLGLAGHLAGVDLHIAAKLETDPALRAFMTASSEAWGIAAVEFGSDPEETARTVAATTLFYVPPRS